jgi:hypothetical protein
MYEIGPLMDPAATGVLNGWRLLKLAGTALHLDAWAPSGDFQSPPLRYHARVQQAPQVDQQAPRQRNNADTPLARKPLARRAVDHIVDYPLWDTAWL